MFDKEIEAIAKCTDLIKELDDKSKMRVIKYLIERFEIGAQSDNTISYSAPKPFQGNQLLESTKEEYVEPSDNEMDFPSLRELLIKDLPKTESEWILCYAFYASDFGNDVFAKESLIDRYKENGRFSESNRKNFAANLNKCIKSNWIKHINGSEHILKPEGIVLAKEILNRSTTTKN